MSYGPSSTTPDAEGGVEFGAGEPAPMDHVFRHYAAQVVAQLVREFGVGQLQLAEDAVQDALVKALGHWSYRGMPSNPGGWIYRVARNNALDALRRQRRFDTGAVLDHEVAAEELPGSEELFADDQLTMMFLCCHPLITPDSAVVLTLKEVGGFGVPEIARAYVCTESAIRQRLVRAKRALRLEDAPFALPTPEQMDARLDRVLRVLYLMFSEGHHAYRGDLIVRADVCAEAIRLTSLLVASDMGGRPRARALLALMLLQAARLDARIDGAGELVLLDDQDRGRWNQAMIVHGINELERSATGDELSDYHLEAGIAAFHAVAPSIQETDWRAIVDHYDVLLERNRSALVALNRAIAVAYRDSPEAGLRGLSATELAAELDGYHLYHAAVGELLRRTGRFADAAASNQRALTLATNAGERRLLERRLMECRSAAISNASDSSSLAIPLSPR